jgi:quercetin dioxygenase-like cupin family protein
VTVDKNYSMLPTQQAYKIDIDNSPVIAEAGDVNEEEVTPMEIRSTILTNDCITTWTQGEPNDVIPWHSHSPEMYQVLVNIDGRCRWHYKGNDGQEKSIVGGPGDIIYLPAGAENKVEVVGDEPHTHIGFLKRPRVPRVEHLYGDTEDLYDPREFPAAFVYDDMNDQVVRKKDKAVSR